MRTWQLAQEALRLCASSFSRRERLPKSLSSAGVLPASAGGGGTGVPRIRRSTQSPRFTGLVRNGADVEVRMAPKRSRPPRWKLSGIRDQFDRTGRLDLFLHAVEFGQRLVEEAIVGEQDFADRTVFADDMFEERDGLVVHGAFDFVGEFRKRAVSTPRN